MLISNQRIVEKKSKDKRSKKLLKEAVLKEKNDKDMRKKVKKEIKIIVETPKDIEEKKRRKELRIQMQNGWGKPSKEIKSGQNVTTANQSMPHVQKKTRSRTDLLMEDVMKELDEEG